MIRRFNYTGRRKILTSDFECKIQHRENESSMLFFHFEDDFLTGFPPHTEIVLEIYKGPKSERINLGSATSFNNDFSQALDNWDSATNILGRIKIISLVDRKRKLLAWAHQFRPVEIDSTGRSTKSILPVEAKNLGSEVWRLELNDPTSPVLFVNSQISDVREVTSIVENDADFSALVFPDILRKILDVNYIKSDDPPEEDFEWAVFAEKLGAGAPPEDDDDDKTEHKLWIDRAVHHFCQHIDSLPRYKDFKRGNQQ